MSTPIFGKSFVARTLSGEYWTYSGTDGTVTLTTASEAKKLCMTLVYETAGAVSVHADEAEYLTNRNGAPVMGSWEARDIMHIVIGPQGSIGFFCERAEGLLTIGNQKYFELLPCPDELNEPLIKIGNPISSWQQRYRRSISSASRDGKCTSVGTYAMLTYRQTQFVRHGLILRETPITDAALYPDKIPITAQFEIIIDSKFRCLLRPAGTRMNVIAQTDDSLACVESPPTDPLRGSIFFITLDVRTARLGLLPESLAVSTESVVGPALDCIRELNFVRVRDTQDYRLFGVPKEVFGCEQLHIEGMTLGDVKSKLSLLLAASQNLHHHQYALVKCDSNGVPHLKALTKAPNRHSDDEHHPSRLVKTHLRIVFGPLPSSEDANANGPCSHDHSSEVAPPVATFQPSSDDEWNLIDE